MTKTRMCVPAAMLVAWIGLSAQAKAVEAGCISLEVPPEWTRSAEGAAVRFGAPGDPGFSLWVAPPEDGEDIQQWFAGAWAALKASYSDVRESEVSIGDSNGNPVRVGGGSMVDAQGRELYAMLFAIQSGSRVQAVVMFAQDFKTYSRYGEPFQQVVRSVRFLPESRWPAPAKKRLADGGWSALSRTLGPAPKPQPSAAAQGSAPAQQGPKSGSGTRNDVVGKWRSGSVSSVGFYSPTGGWAPPSGTGMSYEFKADGSFEYGGLLQSSLYNCTTSIFFWKAGSWSESGGVLTLKPGSARIKSKDNCVRSGNYDRPGKLEPSSFQWHLEQDGAQTYLVLTDNGNAVRYAHDE